MNRRLSMEVMLAFWHIGVDLLLFGTPDRELSAEG
jgi:hypothetical protein